MQIENRLDFIRSYLDSARVAEEGLLPFTKDDINEALAELGTFTNDPSDEEDDEFGPSREMREAFGK